MQREIYLITYVYTYVSVLGVLRGAAPQLRPADSVGGRCVTALHGLSQ